jgi:hypothetical protein
MTTLVERDFVALGILDRRLFANGAIEDVVDRYAFVS